ncbi:MAG: phage protein [Clostridiaceae bacterium]|jgi:hypothetical protein|nr:phage protein [Clostridiaceae bacterium]
MLPEVDANFTIVTQSSQPSKTFKLNTDKSIVLGNVDKLEALKQAIYIYLNIERYESIIYSWNIGVQTSDLIGEDYDYVCSELERRITNALTYDDRINSVDSFSFAPNKDSLTISFTVNTIYGNVDATKEVDI